MHRRGALPGSTMPRLCGVRRLFIGSARSAATHENIRYAPDRLEPRRQDGATSKDYFSNFPARPRRPRLLCRDVRSCSPRETLRWKKQPNPSSPSSPPTSPVSLARLVISPRISSRLHWRKNAHTPHLAPREIKSSVNISTDYSFLRYFLFCFVFFSKLSLLTKKVRNVNKFYNFAICVLYYFETITIEK